MTIKIIGWLIVLASLICAFKLSKGLNKKETRTKKGISLFIVAILVIVCIGLPMAFHNPAKTATKSLSYDHADKIPVGYHKINSINKQQRVYRLFKDNGYAVAYIKYTEKMSDQTPVFNLTAYAGAALLNKYKKSNAKGLIILTYTKINDGVDGHKETPVLSAFYKRSTIDSLSASAIKNMTVNQFYKTADQYQMIGLFSDKSMHPKVLVSDLQNLI